MHHASSRGRSRQALSLRSRLVSGGLALAAAASVFAAAPAASAQQPPALGYTFGAWPPPTRFDGSTPDAASPSAQASSPRPRDAVEKAPPSKEGGPGLDIGAATEVPLMVGGQATLELPYRFLVQGEVGVLPAAFVNGIDSVLVKSGAYSASTSTMVRGTLQNSLVVRASAGFRPFETHGLEIMGGYTLASLTGGTTARQAVESISGVSVPAEIADAQIQLRTTIHSLHVSLGWRWIIGDHFTVRASLAYLQSVASSSSLAVPATVASMPGVAARVDQVNQALNTTLNDTFTRYAKIPVMGLSLGYRF